MRIPPNPLAFLHPAYWLLGITLLLAFFAKLVRTQSVTSTIITVCVPEGTPSNASLQFSTAAHNEVLDYSLAQAAINRKPGTPIFLEGAPTGSATCRIGKHIIPDPCYGFEKAEYDQIDATRKRALRPLNTAIKNAILRNPIKAIQPLTVIKDRLVAYHEYCMTLGLRPSTELILTHHEWLHYLIVNLTTQPKQVTAQYLDKILCPIDTCLIDILAMNLWRLQNPESLLKDTDHANYIIISAFAKLTTGSSKKSRTLLKQLLTARDTVIGSITDADNPIEERNDRLFEALVKANCTTTSTPCMVSIGTGHVTRPNTLNFVSAKGTEAEATTALREGIEAPGPHRPLLDKLTRANTSFCVNTHVFIHDDSTPSPHSEL